MGEDIQSIGRGVKRAVSGGYGDTFWTDNFRRISRPRSYRVAWEPQHVLIENIHGSMPLAKHQSNSGRRSTPVTLFTSVIESKGKFSFSCARRMASLSGPFVKQKALRPFTFT